MKKAILGILFLSMIIFAGMFMIHSSKITNSSYHNKQVEDKLNQLIKKGETEIDINSITNFKWKKGYVFTPYTSEEMMSKEIGLEFKDKAKLYQRDDIFLLILVDSKDKIHYIEIKRKFNNNSIEDVMFIPSNSTLLINSLIKGS